MTPDEHVATIEAAYLEARDARDRLDVARARGGPEGAASLAVVDAAAESAAPAKAAESAAPAGPPTLAAVEAKSATAEAHLRAAMARLPSAAEATLDPADRRAVAAMRAGIETAFGPEAGLPTAPPIPREACDDEAAWQAAVGAGGAELGSRLDACYGAIAGALAVDGETTTRPRILGRLATEADARTRRRLFLALQPLWRVVDGDGLDRSPYRALVRQSATRWAEGSSPIVANARSLAVSPAAIEDWATAALEAWREAVTNPAARAGEPPIEPWDWWWTAGAADRALGSALPLERVFTVNRAYHAALGADLDALRVRLDTTPRPDRPAVPVAFTTFGGRPHRREDGTWSPGEPTVLASYVDGGLGELTELVHETGHAIHIAGIRTRPAFADWPASDALTEALAEVVSLDVAEPAWQARWLPGAPALSAGTSLRCRYADVVLDAAWALFEIRLHARPDRRPNDVWTEITSTNLGIAPHPEWSWWAIRGQLVQEPGYMANYAIGAVLAADIRKAIRTARGDWVNGDAGWYGWVREHVYRFGLERSPADVLLGLLGRPPSVEALLAEIARARQ